MKPLCLFLISGLSLRLSFHNERRKPDISLLDLAATDTDYKVLQEHSYLVKSLVPFECYGTIRNSTRLNMEGLLLFNPAVLHIAFTYDGHIVLLG